MNEMNASHADINGQTLKKSTPRLESSQHSAERNPKAADRFCRNRRHPLAFLLLLVILVSAFGMLNTPGLLQKGGISACGYASSARLLREKKNSIDVLVVGDSESYTSVSPMELWEKYGITSYVDGKPGAKIADSKEMLSEAFSCQSPKVVCLETNNLFRYHAVNGKGNDLSNTIYRILPGLKYHNAWKSFTALEDGKSFKGFKLNAVVRPYNGTSAAAVTGDKVTKDSLTYLDEIQKMCEAHGTRLILYSAPSPQCYTPEKTRILSAIARERGLSYVNLNEMEKALQIDWSQDTRDQGDHLNTAGAVKTSDYMGAYLRNDCGVPDRSSSACAASWNKTLAVYKPALAKTLEKISLNAGNGRKGVPDV